MKRELLYIFCGVAMLTAVSCESDNSEPIHIETETSKPSSMVEGELLVKFTPEVVEIVERAGLARGGEFTRSGVASLDKVLEIVGGCYIERLFPIDEVNEERTRSEGLHRWFVVRFDKNISTADVAARFAQLGEVQDRKSVV